MENGRRLFKKILWILPALMGPPAVNFGQSQSDASTTILITNAIAAAAKGRIRRGRGEKSGKRKS